MQTIRLIFTLVFLFAGCSHPPAANKWQYDAVSALQSYEQHFLQKRLLRAKSDLSRARSLASQSAELHIRIDIELSVCALQLSVLRPSSCKNASDLLKIEPDDARSAYLDLLRSEIKTDEIRLLPAQYIAFAQAMAEKDTDGMNKAISRIAPLSSRLVASALAKEQIDEQNIRELISELSYHGYKNPLLSWLKVQMQKEPDPLKKARLEAKIAVLTSD